MTCSQNILEGSSVDGAYLINPMPINCLKGTPISLLPHIHDVFPLPPHVFGCVSFIHDIIPHINKLDPHIVESIFLGYSNTQKGYKCYVRVQKIVCHQKYYFLVRALFISCESSSAGVLRNGHDGEVVSGLRNLS